MLVFQALLTTGSLLTLSWGYASGPPVGHCGDLFPHGHQVDAQLSATPYVINVSSTQYNPGDTLQITVNGSSSFRGVFLQARRLLNCSDTTPLGFFALQAGETDLQLIACSAAADSVGHNSASDKTVKTFSWTAPSQAVGHLYFRATIVQTKSIFWTTTFSEFISDTSNTSPLPSDPCDVRTALNGASDLMTNLLMTLSIPVFSALVTQNVFVGI